MDNGPNLFCNRWDAFFCNGSHGRYAWVGLVRKSLGKPLWCRTKWKNLTWRKGHQKACLPTCWTWMMISGIFIWRSFYRTFYRVQTYTKHYQDYNHKILTILLNKITFFFKHNQYLNHLHRIFIVRMLYSSINYVKIWKQIYQSKVVLSVMKHLT